MTRPYTEKNYAELSAGLAAGKDVSEIMLTPPKVRLKNNNEESRMQKALIRYWQFACRGFGVHELCLFAIPNGGKRSAIVGSIMKAEGTRKGCPDLFLAVPSKPMGESKDPYAALGFALQRRHGLFIELKTPTGRLSPEQIEYHDILSRRGYSVKVCRSTEEAIAAITNYLT